jgi:hypothetical protein
VLIHRDVVNEVNPVLPRVYRNWREKGLVSEEISEIRRKHAAWVSNKCSDVALDALLGVLEQEGISRLDPGEKACLALAKHTSDDRIVYTLLLTDDYDAGECAEAIFQKYQCGFVVRTADIISFFGLRYKCTKMEIHQALRDLLSFYTNVYESLLSEVKLLLPKGKDSPIATLLLCGEFAGARIGVARLDLSADRRIALISSIDKASELAGTQSIIGYTLACLRTIIGVTS